MTRTYDYPYFNLRLNWGEVEAEEYRVRVYVLKGRAACSRGGPALHDGGDAGFLSTREWPQLPAHPGTRKRPQDSTPNVLNAALGRVRFPAVGVAGFKSLLLAWRVIRTSAAMHAYVLTVDFLSSGVQVARHGHHRICSLDRPWVDIWRRTTGGLLEVSRRARGSGASPPAIWRSIRGRAPI